MTDDWTDHILKEYSDKGVSLTQSCALDVLYFRERQRHTPELEARLVQEHAEGKTVNIMEWPPEYFAARSGTPGPSYPEPLSPEQEFAEYNKARKRDADARIQRKLREKRKL